MPVYCTYAKTLKRHRWLPDAQDGDSCACGSTLLNRERETKIEAAHEVRHAADRARARVARWARGAKRDERFKRAAQRQLGIAAERALHPDPPSLPPIPAPEPEPETGAGDFLARYSHAERAVILGDFEPDNGLDYYFSCDGDWPHSLAYRNRRGEFVVAGRWSHHHPPA